MPLIELQSALGHASFQSTLRYAQIASKQRAAQVANAVLGSALSVEDLWPDSSKSSDRSEESGDEDGATNGLEELSGKLEASGP